ncbi:proteinkinasesubdomain-containingproteinpkl/ ccin9 [Gigaspora margarita]|uniref:Proteinkinasesubdomain-containingproteinpkl/ ccin9 n=1 Tax=Gigaspora margarita TaxID=4874 RepID=A0A8H4A7B5_GIGMA|nr:proteinkinasesubdomain-containingproteinpkl/ ccin9 [Gigaspora margarita]
MVTQPLTEPIPLTVDIRRKDQVNRVARFFQALQIAFGHLSKFYQELDITPTEQRYFPYLQQFRGIANNNTINFTYIEKLTDDPARTIWKAKTTNDDVIVVKFVTE